VFYLHGGGFERRDKRMPGTPFYDNLMLWLAQQGTRSRSRIASMAALTIPLFVSCTEIDLPAAISQAEKVISARQAGGHPSNYAMFRDHSHISQNYSIGTADMSVSAPILELIHQTDLPGAL
jgi:hypothetical protein